MSEEGCLCPKPQTEDCCPTIACMPSCDHVNHDRALIELNSYKPPEKDKCPSSDRPRDGRRGRISFSLTDCPPCPTDQAVAQSIRMQEIFMQQMQNEFLLNRARFKASIKPNPSTLENVREKKKCSGDVDLIKEMLCQLKKEFQETKEEFDKLRSMQKENDRKRTLEGPKCTCK
ncbi:hypothetical protein RUM44_013438 [Polyplax serrata]|uniref:Uncharacterized protein n=1 Tax=Polyplax serrata TaxID=468196 RepID=A0ABR1BIW7_POLSC